MDLDVQSDIAVYEAGERKIPSSLYVQQLRELNCQFWKDEVDQEVILLNTHHRAATRDLTKARPPSY